MRFSITVSFATLAIGLAMSQPVEVNGANHNTLTTRQTSPGGGAGGAPSIIPTDEAQCSAILKRIQGAAGAKPPSRRALSESETNTLTRRQGGGDCAKLKAMADKARQAGGAAGAGGEAAGSPPPGGKPKSRRADQSETYHTTFCPFSLMRRAAPAASDSSKTAPVSPKPSPTGSPKTSSASKPTRRADMPNDQFLSPRSNSSNTLTTRQSKPPSIIPTDEAQCGSILKKIEAAKSAVSRRDLSELDTLNRRQEGGDCAKLKAMAEKARTAAKAARRDLTDTIDNPFGSILRRTPPVSDPSKTAPVSPKPSPTGSPKPSSASNPTRRAENSDNLIRRAGPAASDSSKTAPVSPEPSPTGSPKASPVSKPTRRAENSDNLIRRAGPAASDSSKTAPVSPKPSPTGSAKASPVSKPTRRANNES
ncbi:hypothetical protein DFH28DRAFT_1217152 [Melampsora americana]|nr:hypothetical protein DFH28DRAFT_1217152 [Melampsora americana]